MNKFFTKIATLSVGLLMAIGVGVGIGANKGASPTQAGTAGSSYTEDSTLAVGGTIDTSAYYVLKSTNGYYYNGSVSSKWGVTSNSLSDASLLQLSGTSTSFTIYDTSNSKYLKYASGDFQVNATSTNFMILAASSNDSTPAVKYSSSGSTSSITAVLKANTGSQSKMRWYTTVTYSSTMIPVSLVKLRAAAIPVTAVGVSGTGVSNNALSIGSSDTSKHTINVTLTPNNATDQKVNIAYLSGTNDLFTASAEQITCSNGSGSFTLEGTGATSGSETFRISANTETAKYVDLVVTALDDSITYYTVTFNSNGGSASPADKQVEKDNTFEFPSPGTIDHYSFLGWSSDGGTTKHATGATSPKVTDDIAYTAYWQEDAKHTITYAVGDHGQYDGSTTKAFTVYEGVEHTVKAPAAVGISADGNYTFIGWDDGSTDYAPDSTYTMGETDVVLTAQWEEKNSILYDLSEMDGFKDWGTSYTSHSSDFAITGGGKATVTIADSNHQTGTITDVPVSKGGDVTFVLSGTSKTIKNATFNARQWSSKAQTMELHYSTDNGATYATTNITSDNFSITKNGLPEGTNAIKVTFDSPSNQVGYVSFEIEYKTLPKYTVSFDANTEGYGTLSASSIADVESGTTISVNNNQITIGDTTVTATPAADTAQYTYAFSSWSNAGETVTEAITITANFTRTLRSYSVGGTINNGSLSSTDSINYGSALNITINPNSNYTYPSSLTSVTMGNNPLTEGSGYTYNASTGAFSIPSVTGEVVINASCVPVVPTYTVTYDSDGGSDVASEIIIQGGHPTFPASTKAGYNFKGWQVNGEGTVYTSENAEDYTVSGVVTFVAKWAELFTVSFSNDDGSTSPENLSVEDGATFTFPSAGTRTHYTFAGWSSDGGTNKYAAGATSPVVTAAISYTAYWTEDAKATVTYTAGDNCTGSYEHTLQYLGDYDLLDIEDLDGIEFDSNTYRFKDFTVAGESKNVGDTVTLPAGGLTVVVNFELIPDETTTTKTMSEIVSENSYTVSSGTNVTIINEFNLDTNVVVSTSGEANCGSFWGTSPSIDWRLYQNKGGDITISVPTGCELESITIVYSQNNSGVLLDGSTQITTGTEVTVSGTSKTFTVGNSGSATNGQVRVTSISVTYLGASSIVSYTITYDKNAESATGTMNPTIGADPAVAACTFEYEGHSFARWNTQADGEGDDYAVGATPGEDLTLYAIWQEEITPIGANVTMDVGTNASAATVNGHSGIKCGTGSKKGSMTLTLNESGMTHIKFYIAGWGTDTTNNTVSISIDSGTVSTESLTLTNDTGISGSSNAFTLQGNETDYRVDLTLTNASQGAVITIQADNASNNRFVVWGATDLFAETFASEFMTGLKCNAAGTSAPTFEDGYSWAYFEGFYNGLDDEEKALLQNADANQGGTQIEQAMARYDYVEGKYNPSNSDSSPWKNFIGRTVTPVGSGRVLLGIVDFSNNNTVTIIVVISMVSLISLGGYFYLRKRKEQ